MSNKTITSIGLMSGTSLDGVDIACCFFEQKNNNWSYEILSAETIEYPFIWKNRLKEIEHSDAFSLARTNSEYGIYLGRLVKLFTEKFQLKADIVSSHGHTIFHQPSLGLTLQIGHGANIAAESGLITVCDFRTMDVALGGQGAPLVPIGDKYLFGSYSHCLNLGGFCNISFEKNGERIAYDISPCNIVLNYFTEKLSLPFDNDGRIAQSGNLNIPLLSELNSLPFYSLIPPKSLGKEWVYSEFLPIIKEFKIPVPDILRSLVEHIAIQISSAIEPGTDTKLLVSGGGVHNGYLLSRLKELNSIHIEIPDRFTIDFKEALIFAFLGALRYTGEINVLSSVTGAIRNNIGGAIYTP